MSLPASTLTWVAHDPDEKARVDRILAALGQSESRDELGLGGVRDSFAALLFPGTSTIQTRLRYFLIVPWCFRVAEEERLQAPAFGQRVRELERSLIDVLNDTDADGVFGRVTGKAVKRLPSSVYWNGLGTWGIREVRVSQATYERHIGQFHNLAATEHATEDGERVAPRPKHIWHPHLPDIPEGFPEQVDFRITEDEASFLRDRIREQAPHTLLDWLARRPEHAPDVTGASFPWLLPCLGELPEGTQELLAHARWISELGHGAAQLYNLMLAQMDRSSDGSGRLGDIEDARLDGLRAWWKQLAPRLDDLARLDLGRTRDLCDRATAHTVRSPTWTFLGAWRDRVVATAGKVAEDEAARGLVRHRERSQKAKRGRSRFDNPTLRAQWKGAAGLARLDFRWGPTRRLLRDLYAADLGDA